MQPADEPPQSTDQQPRALGPRAEDAEAADPPTQLRVVGADLVLPLDAMTELFWLGSGVDVHLHLPHRYVSRRHASLRRLRGKLDVTNHSSNGTRVDGQSIGDAILGAGDAFEVGATTLVILDEPMVRLRAVLARAIGFAAHAEVDRALVLAMRQVHVPLILTGPRGAESERLAEAIHQATPRRSRPFEVIDARAPTAAVEARLRAATGGTVFVDVRPLKNRQASKALVSLLGDPTFRTRLIIGAVTSEQVRLAFDHDVTKLGEIRTPPVLARVPEIPALLDAYMAETGSRHTVADLPDDGVEALVRFGWPENLEEIRRAAERLAAFFDCSGNISATARQLGLSPQTLSEWFARVGVVPRQRRRRRGARR